MVQCFFQFIYFISPYLAKRSIFQHHSKIILRSHCFLRNRRRIKAKQAIILTIMGCVPPERTQQSAASASNPIKKIPSIKKIESSKSRNSSHSTEKHLKFSQENLSSSQSLKQQNKKSQNNQCPNYKKGQSKLYANFSKKTDQNIHSDNSTKLVIRASPTKQQAKHEIRVDEVSKIVSVHSLDLNSRIKIPMKESNKEISNEQSVNIINSGPYRHQDINITFNNNDFATANSKTGSLGMGKRWREQTLRQQLRGINQQNFKKISIQTMPFN